MICKLIIDQDHHDESFVHLMPELRCHKTDLISNCTKNNVTVLHCVSDASVIQLQCNLLHCDIIDQFELVLSFFFLVLNASSLYFECVWACFEVLIDVLNVSFVALFASFAFGCFEKVQL